MSINVNLNILQKFYNDNLSKLESVANREAHPEEDLKRFYLNIYSQNWKEDLYLAYRLIQFLSQNQVRINRSLAQINTTRTRSEESQSSEYKLRNSKPFFKTVGDESSELSYEFDAVYPANTAKITFQKAKQNENPRLNPARSAMRDKIITTYVDQNKLNLIPSNAKNGYKAIILGMNGYKYWDHFKPTPYNYDFYDKSQGKKHVGMPGTWMFDLMYFSNYGNKKLKTDSDLKYKQAIYLVGININTRFAVGRRINGKSVQDLIPPFEDLLKNELKGKINLLIFDGEKAISSNAFKSFCEQNRINVRITYPGIHTQTAPIDRLCRTLRDYYSKMFMTKLYKGTENNVEQLFNEYNKNPWLNNKKFKEGITTESIYVRKMFDGEHTSYLPPIPSQYLVCEDKFKYGKYDLKLYEENSNLDLIKKRYKRVEIKDELYDVIDYYNNKSHHGLINTLKYASKFFNVPILLSDEEITPKNINEHPALELLIIKYNRYYNKNIAKPGIKYKIGDKVRVFNCFNEERGKLKRKSDETLMGDWEIVSKDNEIYGVYNNFNKQLLHVSKYMIRPK